MINFVSNLPADLRSGGFSAVNAAAFRALNQVETLHYVGPVNPPPLLHQKVVSKLLRVARLGGDFFFYSPRRLATIAEAVHSGCDAEARLDFFLGFTAWISTKPARPYVACSDCAFHDYIRIYHRPDAFRAADLARIEQAEGKWLRGARAVAFTSAWTADRSTKYYGLAPERVHNVGIFGEIEMPEADAYGGGREFIFVSTNFEAKGGKVVLAAFRRLREVHKDVSLVIVGAQPEGGVQEPNVVCTGFLRKENAEQRARFRDLLGRARALVHPSVSDISPLIVVEAGYFGCPAIASRKFAIPELIDHGSSGFLVDDPSDVSVVAGAMARMLEDEGEYRGMRARAWAKTRQHHSKAAFERKLQALIRAE